MRKKSLTPTDDKSVGYIPERRKELNKLVALARGEAVEEDKDAPKEDEQDEEEGKPRSLHRQCSSASLSMIHQKTTRQSRSDTIANWRPNGGATNVNLKTVRLEADAPDASEEEEPEKPQKKKRDFVHVSSVAVVAVEVVVVGRVI